jgi:hypothetical protein
MNDRIFEDRERTLEELKFFFFYSLYIWTAAFVAPLEISFHDFLVFFFLLLARCFSYILLVYLICTFIFNDISITCQKKKKRQCHILARHIYLRSSSYWKLPRGIIW